MGLAMGTLARNTTAAVIITFVYLFVLENLVRGLRPEWVGWLFGDNAGIFIVGHRMSTGASGSGLSHGPGIALLIIAAYAGVLSALALALFLRRDVT